MTTKDVLALAANEFHLVEIGQRGNGLHAQTVKAITAITAIKQAITPETGNAATPEASAITAGNGHAPYSNCRFRICDLPGQCKGEGKCHHPAVQQAQEPVAIAKDCTFQATVGSIGIVVGGPAPKQAEPAIKESLTVQWQPIESAPKDGTVIDLWHEEFGRYPDCYWGLPAHTCGEMGSLCDSDVHSMDEGWVDTFNEIQFPANQYTHWMKLPTPPEAA